MLAADRLEPGSPVAGKTYFVTQGETIPLWDMIDHLLKAAGLDPVRRSISRPLAWSPPASWSWPTASPAVTTSPP